ncbi:rhodanese-like domain-containing protein [Desulfomicrobium salsuginis]
MSGSTCRRVALAVTWFMALLLAGCLREDARLLEPRAALELVERNRGKADFLILDVRTPGEFRQGYIEGAVLLDYYEPDFRERFAALDRTATIFTYCRSGNRSSHVLALADELGFQRVFDLRGGILAWKSEGLPLAGSGTAP